MKKKSYLEVKQSVQEAIDKFRKDKDVNTLNNVLIGAVYIQNEYIIEMLEKQKGEGNE